MPPQPRLVRQHALEYDSLEPPAPRTANEIEDEKQGLEKIEEQELEETEEQELEKTEEQELEDEQIEVLDHKNLYVGFI